MMAGVELTPIRILRMEKKMKFCGVLQKTRGGFLFVLQSFVFLFKGHS